MKKQNRVSPLTLELYHRGLATRKERKQVENALVTDSEVRKRYDALQESDREIRRLVTRELNRLDIPERPFAPVPKSGKAVWVIAAALILCAAIPAFIYFSGRGAFGGAKGGVEIAADPDSVNMDEEDNIIEDLVQVSAEPEEDRREKKIESNTKPAIAAHNEPEKKETAKEHRGVSNTEEKRVIEEQSGVVIATAPEPDTGIRMRGGESPHGNTETPPEQPSNITLPPGLTFIFESMFAGKGLTFVIIPSRITSIGKNAFADNPLTSITIGANVAVEESAFPGNFAGVYNGGGKAAGKYVRANVGSDIWVRE